jgi:hypothetical protein
MNIIKMANAAAVECERQQVGLDSVARLLEAAHIVNRRVTSPKGPGLYSPNLDEGFWKYIAGLIEPRNLSTYRQVPVTFADLGSGIPWANVPRAMETWWAEIPEVLKRREDPDFMVSWVDNLVRDFLKIHPFVDGNGRTAWLLRVWMLNQWDNPQPLPDFFAANVGKQTV